METKLLIWIELDNPLHPDAGRACPGTASATKVEPLHVVRFDDRRRKMIRDTEVYLGDPLSKPWARLSRLRPRATVAACGFH